MAETLTELIEKVTDETSFLRFLKALREDYERTERECLYRDHHCFEEGHWESRSVRDFLRGAEDWGTRGDFGEGRHYGEPMLRRIACLLYAGRFRVHEDESPR